MLIAVRRLIPVAMVTIVLATSAAAEDPDEQKRFSVNVAKAQERRFPNPAVLASECGTEARIYACTVFADEQLSCACTSAGDHWRIRANAHFVPIMCLYLRHPRIIAHEQLHIDDVRAMLEVYLQGLTSREFESEEQCAQQARKSSDEKAFVRQMNEFRQRSNEKLH
jgi:hypothetical protein